jgi:EXLDI family protein
MPNKTIYVSDKDVLLFEQAKEIAGEALSSVIVRALKEFVSRNQELKKGMKEVSLKVGINGIEREQRFIGSWVGEWRGFSDDKVWYMKAVIYRTQKENWAVLLETICKASLLTDKKGWKESGDYLINAKKSVLLIAKTPQELRETLPEELYHALQDHAVKTENPIEYLDI